MGRASALALAGMGAQVLVHYSSGLKEAETVVAKIRKAGGRADAVAADLSAPDGAHKLAKQVRAVVGDRLDILVANAGTSKSATIEETTVEDFDRLSRSTSARRGASTRHVHRSGSSSTGDHILWLSSGTTPNLRHQASGGGTVTITSSVAIVNDTTWSTIVGTW